MSNFLILDWLEENARRGYPLKDSTDFRIPGISEFDLRTVLLDAQLNFTGATLPDSIALTGIEVSAGNLMFHISGGQSFLLPDYTSASYPYYARNELGSLLVIGETIRGIEDTTPLLAAEFEPSVINHFDPSWFGVNSVSFNGEGSLYGLLRWLEGYQFLVDIEGNEVKLGARKNYGKPIDCHKFFDDVVDDCSDVISYINGVTVNSNPGKFSLNPGSHIAIFDDPLNHRIYIGLNFAPSDVCPPVVPNPSPNTK